MVRIIGNAESSDLSCHYFEVLEHSKVELNAACLECITLQVKTTTGARSARRFMLDFAKLIHEAIGIESPRAFIALFALVGLLLFGVVGWLVDKGYRAKLKETTQATESLPSGPDRKTKERIFLPPDIDCKYLTGLYENHTAMQADQLAASYVGKWMRMNCRGRECRLRKVR